MSVTHPVGTANLIHSGVSGRAAPIRGAAAVGGPAVRHRVFASATGPGCGM